MGPWGPFRGRLGAQWWIASLVVGALLLVAGWLILFRDPSPGEGWSEVTRVEALPPGGIGTDAGGGVWIARLEDGRVRAVREEPGCPVRPVVGAYFDCQDRAYALDGQPLEEKVSPLEPVRILVHDGTIYVPA